MIRPAAVILALFVAAPVLAQDPSKLVYFTRKQIETDIRKAPANEIGESEINLIERTPQHAGILLRRTKPGKAESHTTEADVWYVIDGKEVRPGQIQGTGITGGTDYKLGKGDFMRIPPGVPHWVKTIEGSELVYIVVKYVDK